MKFASSTTYLALSWTLTNARPLERQISGRDLQHSVGQLHLVGRHASLDVYPLLQRHNDAREVDQTNTQFMRRSAWPQDAAAQEKAIIAQHEASDAAAQQKFAEEQAEAVEATPGAGVTSMTATPGRLIPAHQEFIPAQRRSALPQDAVAQENAIIAQHEASDTAAQQKFAEEQAEAVEATPGAGVTSMTATPGRLIPAHQEFIPAQL